MPKTKTQPIEAPTWHAQSATDVANALKTDSVNGLTQAEAQHRLATLGKNVLVADKGRSPLIILLHQFKSLIVLLLVAATAVSFSLGELAEAIAILVVIVLNAAIGFFIEWKADRTLSALQAQSVHLAQAVRDGTVREIPGADVVVGDVLMLSAGARVPADGRLLNSVHLQIEEAALTGESAAVVKNEEVIGDKQAVLAERLNMVFMGTAVTDGRAHFVVTATGAKTEMGKIGTLINEASTQDTPLERKLSRLSLWLIIVVLLLAVVIVVAGWLRGMPFLPMLEIGISLAIAAVPEGLAAVTTMTLAIGMQRIAKQRALIRRLPAVETLGSTTVICTDKTGTLTKNEMTVRAFMVNDRRIDVSGSGYQTTGEFSVAGVPLTPSTDASLMLALRVGALCNDARVEHGDGKDLVLGDPTEGALLVVAEKAGLKLAETASQLPRIHELPFQSATQIMATVHQESDGKNIAYVKGSPGKILQASKLDTQARAHLLQQNMELAGKALRVLGLAYRELGASYQDEDLGRDLTFIGFVGMEDPIRDEAKAAIETCLKAGIRTIMITGDQPATAGEIARQLGLHQDADGTARAAVHARDLADMTPEKWREVTKATSVFARVSPEQKLRIVEALQQNGDIVAMTGDGVNDAPALKTADIGIAMGLKGTEVAKETASMILTDDNFSTIVGAIEQGRTIYANIMKFIHYLFSCNTAEIITVFVAVMVGWPVPLAALQILWLNMITDVFPALALALEPSAPNMMSQPPRDPKAPIISLSMAWTIVWQGLMLGGASLVAFMLGLRWYGSSGEGLRQAMTMAFSTLALVQILHAFSSRSNRRSILSSGPANYWLWGAVLFCTALQLAAVYVPFLKRILQTSTPNAEDWAVIVVCSVVPVIIGEIVKVAKRVRQPQASHR